MKPNWQIEIDEYLKTISNEELLYTTINLSGGDDYDGCFTARGEYEFKVYQTELEKRLTDIGFFNPPPHK